MTAIPILIADAVAAAINAASVAIGLPDGIEARRSYPDWDDDFKGLSDLAIDVVFVSSNGSNGELAELDSYSSVETEPAIDIAIRKRFAPSDRDSDGRLLNASVDPLVRMAEQMHELFSVDRNETLSLDGGIEANWMDASVRTHCDYRKLREGCFLAVVRVRWDVSKRLS